MKTLTKSIILILSALIFYSCGISREVTSHTTEINKTIQTDSTETKTQGISEVKEQSIVYVPVTDSSLVEALIECDSLSNAYLKEITQYEGGHQVKQKLTASRKNGKLIIRIKASIDDSLRVYKIFKKRFDTIQTTTNKKTDISQKIVENKEVKKKTKFHLFGINTTYLFLAGFFVVIFFIYRRL